MMRSWSFPMTSTALSFWAKAFIEGDFLLAEPFLRAALVRGADVLGEPDQLLNDLRRRDGIGVVAGDRLL